MEELVTRWTKRAKKAAERLDICVQCEYIEKKYYVCTKCGCFLKGKTTFPSSSCPIGKWDKYKEEKE